MVEQAESEIVPIQSTTSFQRQPSTVSQPTPASTPPQTPSLQHPNSTTPVVSGSQVEPVAIPLKLITNSNDTLSGSPTLASLQRAPSAAELHEPWPSAILEGVRDLLIWTLIIQLPFRLKFQVPSLLFYQAGSLNPSRRQQRLSNNHSQIGLSHCLPPHPCASLKLLPLHSLQYLYERRSQ